MTSFYLRGKPLVSLFIALRLFISLHFVLLTPPPKKKILKMCQSSLTARLRKSCKSPEDTATSLSVIKNMKDWHAWNDLALPYMMVSKFHCNLDSSFLQGYRPTQVVEGPVGRAHCELVRRAQRNAQVRLQFNQSAYCFSFVMVLNYKTRMQKKKKKKIVSRPNSCKRVLYA